MEMKARLVMRRVVHKGGRGSWEAGLRHSLQVCWKRGEVALLSPEGSHKRSFRILGEQGSGHHVPMGPRSTQPPSPPQMYNFEYSWPRSGGIDFTGMAYVSCMVGPGRPFFPIIIRVHGQFGFFACFLRLCVCSQELTTSPRFQSMRPLLSVRPANCCVPGPP